MAAPLPLGCFFAYGLVAMSAWHQFAERPRSPDDDKNATRLGKTSWACWPIILRGLFACVIAATTLAVSRLAHADVFASLVGVSEYPSLSEPRQLLGPKADVREMRRFLIEVGIPVEHISVLADGVPESGQLPTRAAILALWRQQHARLRGGDTLLLYFAGHGAQQPQLSGTGYREPDGLDELFLPRDIGRWNANGVANAILDDEIGAHVDHLRDRGINVMAWFDMCHAGDSVRSTRSGQPKIRAVPNEELGVPPMSSVGRRAPSRLNRDAHRLLASPAESGRVIADRTMREGAGSRGFLLALYASRSHERTREEVLPSTAGKHREYRGVFTATTLGILHAELNAIRLGAPTSLSARTLMQRLKTSYLKSSGPPVTPYIEASPIQVAAEPLLRLLHASPR